MSLNFFVGTMISSPALNIIMQIGNLVWFLLVPYVILQVCTHNVIAWATDRMMPENLLRRGGRARSPWLASLCVCFVAALCIAANYKFSFTLVGAAALAGVAFFLTGIGAYCLPKHRPEVFSKAPPLLQQPIFGITLFQLVGLLSSVGFLWLIYASIKYPEISGGTSTRAVIWLLAVYGSGFIVYEFCRARLQRRVRAVGVNLEALFAEIPAD
jgi:amino acid transporter